MPRRRGIPTRSRARVAQRQQEQGISQGLVPGPALPAGHPLLAAASQAASEPAGKRAIARQPEVAASPANQVVNLQSGNIWFDPNTGRTSFAATSGNTPSGTGWIQMPAAEGRQLARDFIASGKTPQRQDAPTTNEGTIDVDRLNLRNPSVENVAEGLSPYFQGQVERLDAALGEPLPSSPQANVPPAAETRDTPGFSINAPTGSILSEAPAILPTTPSEQLIDLGGSPERQQSILLRNAQRAQQSARQANEIRYQQILQGHNALRRQAETAAGQLGQQQLFDIANRYQREIGASEQRLMSRGLGNTTVRESVRRGLLSQALQDATRVQQQNLANQLGLSVGLAQDTLGFAERRTDAGPDASSISAMAQALGQASGSEPSTTQTLLNLIGMAGGAAVGGALGGPAGALMGAGVGGQAGDRASYLF